MAEVVDIQTLDVQRKASASQAKDEMGLWTKSESGIPGKRTLPRLPPIRRSTELSPVPTNTNGSKYKRATSRKRITVSFVKKNSDVNANEVVEEEESHVHQSQDKMSDSKVLETDRSQVETNGGDNSIKTDNPKEYDDVGYKAQNQSYEDNGEQEEEEEEEDDNGTVSKSSSYSVNYPSFSRESSITLPYDLTSIEGMLF